MRRLGVVVVFCVLALALWGARAPIADWALGAQKAAQSWIIDMVRALRAGETAAIWTLLTACFAYGFVHAAGPGHGKVLLGTLGAASQATLKRLSWLAVVASLAQAAFAIVLVYGALSIFALSARLVIDVSARYLLPASFVMIGGIGLILVLRGWRRYLHARHVAHHKPGCGCGHAHVPDADEVANVTRWRDQLALIGAIAIRPCTGAMMLLAIAFPSGLYWQGALAVMCIGAGVATVTVMAALGGRGARYVMLRLAGAEGRHLTYGIAWTQIILGAALAVMAFSAALAAIMAGADMTSTIGVPLFR